MAESEMVEVRREDQLKINRFSALNRRKQELEGDTAALKVSVPLAGPYERSCELSRQKPSQ